MIKRRILLIVSVIIFVISAGCLCAAKLYAKSHNAPLTYAVSLPEPPDGAVLPEKYNIVIPATGDSLAHVSFECEQDARSTSVISMNCDVEVKDALK